MSRLGEGIELRPMLVTCAMCKCMLLYVSCAMRGSFHNAHKWQMLMKVNFTFQRNDIADICHEMCHLKIKFYHKCVGFASRAIVENCIFFIEAFNAYLVRISTSTFIFSRIYTHREILVLY